MSTPGIDYSFARPAPAAVHAAGYRFAVRYLFPGSKGLTRAEADALAAAGLWIASAYESTADWMLGGWPAGAAAARAAESYGHAAGMPAERPVFFGADFDVSEAQMPDVLNCLRGAASVLGKGATGVYGGRAAVKAAFDAGVCAFGWQTAAWSAGVWDPRAQLRQVRVNTLLGGSAVDVNEAMTADFGQWQPGKLPEPAPAKPAKPAPVTIPGDPMLLNKGAGALTPIAIPDTASSLRFLAAGTAQLSVQFHGSVTQPLSLSWAGGSHSLTPPKDVYAVLVTRVDGGTGDVCVVAQ